MTLPTEFIRQELFKGLNKTTKTDVILLVSQVIQVIGLEKTEKLCQFCIEVTEAIDIKKKHRSAIPKDKRLKKFGYGKFNRLAILAAIHATGQSNNRGGTDNFPPGNDAADALRAEETSDPSLG